MTTKSILFKECSIEDRIKSIINDDKSSRKKQRAKISERYYEAEHDIKSYRVFYFNAEGDLVEDTYRSNVKISHPFYTENVDQETDYILSDFSISSTDDELDKILKKYFDSNFQTELHDVVEDTIKLGWSYMYAYLNKDFRTSFKSACGLNIVEVYAEDSDELIYMIYYYVDRIEKNGNVITRIEVHDKEQTFYYVMRGNKKIEKDNKVKINPRPHKVWSEVENGVRKTYGKGFGYIPFFRLKKKKKQISALKPIKALIDDYDLMSCGLSNNLQDVQEAIYVVKGYEGTDLTELQQNIKTKKILGLPEGESNGLDIKTIDVPYQARQTKLDLDEKNIYRFGMSFNASQTGDGNITNIVLKARYTLLDLKCNKLAPRIKALLEEIVQIVLDEINEENKTDYDLNDVEICLDREIPTNERDNAEIDNTLATMKQTEINTLLNIANYIPEETIIKAICEILDIDYSEIENEVKEVINEKKIDLNSASEKLNNDNTAIE